MDIISGIVTATSVFLLAMVIVAVVVSVAFRDPRHSIQPETRSLVQTVMATSLVVYFVAILDLLLIAQQTSLALGTFVIGLVLVVVFYLEPALRGRGREPTEETEGWER